MAIKAWLRSQVCAVVSVRVHLDCLESLFLAVVGSLYHPYIAITYRSMITSTYMVATHNIFL